MSDSLLDPNSENTLGRAVDALVAVLPRSAPVSPPTGLESDLIVGGHPITLTWASDGSLGAVRRHLGSVPASPDVLVARQLSPGARDLLSEAGIGWVDETGAAEIAIGSVIVSRSGRTPPRPQPQPRWTPGVLAVAETLLCGTTPTVAGTREATGLSTGTCTNALRALTELGLLEASAKRGRQSARRVAEPDRLLSAYRVAAPAMTPAASLQVGVSWRDPLAGLAQVGATWDNRGLAWAATGAAAAAVLGPYLTTITVTSAYLDTTTMVGLEAAAREAGMVPIEGGRLTLRPFPTVAARELASTIDSLRLAPWPRVYVDLIATGVRGEEAAEHLREVVRAR